MYACGGMAKATMFIAKIPITATPRTMSKVRIQEAGVAACAGSDLILGRLGLEMDVIGQAHRLDHLELLLERVDVVFLIVEDLGEQVAADVVLDLLAMGDGTAQLGQRLELELMVGLEDFLDVLADPEAAELLEIGQAVQEQDALGELVGVLHLVDRFGALELGEALEAPIVEHPVVQPILVGGGQLVAERVVEMPDDLGVALHNRLPVGAAYSYSRCMGSLKIGGNLRKTCD